MAVVLDLVNNPRPRHPEKAHRPDSPVQKKPDWIRVKAPVSEGYFATQKIMRDNGLHTVCEEAGCPNIGECWEKKHATFSRLAPADRLLVRRLGGILRLADGLDRRRNSLVTAIDCSLSPFTFRIRLVSVHDVSVELFGGRDKGDLFEAAFARKLLLLPPQGSEPRRTAD